MTIRMLETLNFTVMMRDPQDLTFAKERFGGPFTTEQVEDVKTFVRIIGVLLVVGTAYVIDVPTSTISLLFVGQHITLS